MTQEGISRKSFIVGAGAAALSAATLGLFGCASPTPKGSAEAEAADTKAAASGAEAPAAVDEREWDESFDVVVVGSGIAGTSAAVTVATEGNGAICLVLDKGDDVLGGGNTRFSAGAIFSTTNAQNALKYLKALRGENPTVPDDVLEAYANGMAEHEGWLDALGAGDNFYAPWDNVKVTSVSAPEYPELLDTDEERATIGCMLFNGGPDGDGFKHVQTFLSDVLDQHPDTVTRKTGTTVVQLVQDPQTGEILGVVYEEGGKSVSAQATGGVVMCCGGFENNPVMMANYIRSYGAHPFAGICNTGDGIKLCAEVGAEMWHMANIAGFYNGFASLDGEKFVSKNAAQTTRGEGIIVGSNGRRYYMDNGGFGNTNLTEYDLRIHSGYRHGDNNRGGEWMHQSLPAESWFVFDQAGFDAGATAEITEDDPVAAGWGYSADSLTELAKLVGLPEGELEATVEHWNQMCDDGADMAFYRFPTTLNKVATPPFYAMRMVPYFLNTDGGPVRSAKAEVVGRDGNPIPHLYSAGEFGSVWSDMYNAGGNLSEGMAFGRIAARECLGIA
uniref:FAD-dependent oxidoreductase n=1 Tax=Muribaculaceae bacterium Z82 TaxID=2304548 RepID=A0A7C9JDG2_9BACT